jgi:transcriptional regulator with PAS, ATPase and Fis domain
VKLKKSRKKIPDYPVFDALAESNGISALYIGSDYRIKWISPEARRILGVSQDVQDHLCRDLLEGRLCTSECRLSSKEGVTGSSPFQECCFQPSHPPFQIRTELVPESGTEGGGLLKSFRIAPDSIVDDPPSSFVAKGPWAEEILSLLPRIARSDLPILLIGETGTGKECLARMIHQESHRSSGPFVVLDLSLIPDTLVEDALFGHKRGAFTGAIQEQTGKLPLAETGTLFLDEIQNIPHALQTKLLRFLETGTFEPIGSRETRKVDTRIIAATNEPPEDLLRDKRMRPDLFYRLNGLSLEIPPLRERGEDIPLLIESFRADWSRRTGRMAPVFSQELLHQLTSYPFPGNIRELKHLVEATLTLADPAKTLEFDHLPASIRRQLRSRSLPSGDQADTGRSLKEQTFYDFERRRIREALDRSGGRIIEASRSLGISRVTLWRKMKKLALLPDVSS